MNSESPIQFPCGGDALIGMVHDGAADTATGVLIVVGGPQYRAGSHRQFLLLARHLATSGVPAMRFDYRGMGDSEGEYLGFEHVGDDIGAAIDAFLAARPEIRRVVLWGLCDAASAILFYAHSDPRVAGIVLLNPWVRTDAGEARTRIRHYYARKLIDPSFWSKMLGGGLDMGDTLRSLMATMRAVLPGASRRDRVSTMDRQSTEPLPDRMAAGFAAYGGPVLLIISGEDLTAREFEDAARESRPWRRLLREARVARRDLADADHTFSRREWRDRVAGWTTAWVKGL